MKRVKVQIDLKHSQQLLGGKPVAIKVPRGAEVIEVRLTAQPYSDSFAKVLDVFFNGRPA